MSTLTPPLNVVRPVPRKLGPPERHGINARLDWWRQLLWGVDKGLIDARTRDFLVVVSLEHSGPDARDFWPSQTTLAEAHKCSRRTIQRRIANAKKSEMLGVAQVKGFDGTTWYCSSNTHRPKFLPEWAELQRIARAEKREKKRQEKIEGRAQRPGSKVPGSRSEDPSSTYRDHEHVHEAPPAPAPPSLEELEANRRRAAANRAAILRPPP